MADIVERLRDRAADLARWILSKTGSRHGYCPSCGITPDNLTEAADEIERLRAEVARQMDFQRAKERTVEGLKKEVERLEKANKDMAGCHCLQCTDMQCEGPARAIIHPEESDT